jgi:hypothetical protein
MSEARATVVVESAIFVIVTIHLMAVLPIFCFQVRK